RATGLPKCRAGQARSTTVRHDLTRRYKSREHTVRQQAVGPRARALAVGHERSERDGRTGRTGSATTAQAGTDPPGREPGPGDRAGAARRPEQPAGPPVRAGARTPGPAPPGWERRPAGCTVATARSTYAEEGDRDERTRRQPGRSRTQRRTAVRLGDGGHVGP